MKEAIAGHTVQDARLAHVMIADRQDAVRFKDTKQFAQDFIGIVEHVENIKQALYQEYKTSYSERMIQLEEEEENQE